MIHIANYIHFSEEQKLRAGSVDLEEFLRLRGERLIKSGHEKRLESDHSVTVRGSRWYDHAAQRGGGPVSFVQRFYRKSYPEAMTLLLGGSQGAKYPVASTKAEEPRKPFELPPKHKAAWFAGSALNSAEQAMASVLSRLNAFLDSEMEQILCFETAIDAEKFCNEKSAIFVVLPEEDTTKYFMVSLIIQNLYREILQVADGNGGRLGNRVVFYADELGSCPPIQSLELMFSASRSRGVMLVPIVQSITGQLQKNYGKEGAEIIVDNCQVSIFGGFAPNSQTAQELSRSLGSQTILSGSVSKGRESSQTLQMMERPLMTPDELKAMPKGSFVVMKTGVHPMKVRLRLFLDWGIRFGKPYQVPEKAQRPVAYAEKKELENAILRDKRRTAVRTEESGYEARSGGMTDTAAERAIAADETAEARTPKRERPQSTHLRDK